MSLNGKPFTIFYDTGCSDFVLTADAVTDLGTRITQVYTGPVVLGGVGDTETKCVHGIYQIQIPLCEGGNATMSGVCLDNITSPFPNYQLSEAEKDVLVEAGPGLKLPKLPETAGGRVDLMIGIKYLRYHPKFIFQTKTGLFIFKSQFMSINGTRGVIGGPHRSFPNPSFDQGYFSRDYQAIRNHFKSGADVAICGFKVKPQEIEGDSYSFLSRHFKVFNEVEEIGSEISYRCTTCRECKDCKNLDSIQAVSIREEAEQFIINTSVKVDLSSRITEATLPFVSDLLDFHQTNILR